MQAENSILSPEKIHLNDLLNYIEDETMFRPSDFLKLITHDKVHQDISVQMVEYLINSLLKYNLDFRIKKKNNRDYNLVPAGLNAGHKNIVTFWAKKGAISIKIIPYLDKVTNFFAVEEMEKANIENLVKKKYEESVLYF